MGLVNRLVETEALDESVCQLAKMLSQGALLALSTAKVLLNSAATMDRVAAAQAQLFKTDDAREGVAAFLEKRRPFFAGS